MQLRIIIAMICLAVGLCSFGQSKISVGEFYYNEKDLTANRQGTMKRDQNGEVCALIRIQTIEKGFSFDVGSLGIVDVEEEHPA
ncbi:MAG: PEGA domain-containing protein, partial [Bacteroidaceae bacterium]